jgi:Viral BACON domain
MNWVKAIAAVLVLWSSTAWAATLTWTASSEPDLAGYRVYQCSQQPCTQASGKAAALATLGTETSFNIGTPTVTQYYFITAYDGANNESTESNLSTFTPAGTPPPVTPPPGTPPPVTPPPVASPPVAPPPVAPPPVAPPPVVPPAIGVSPLSLSFGATQGGANPATQTVSISNTGGSTLSWSVSDNAPWLTLSRGLGTGNGVVTVSVVAGTTAIGTYNGSITISAIGASPVSVPVTFTVGTAPAPSPVRHHRHRHRHRDLDRDRNR